MSLFKKILLGIAILASVVAVLFVTFIGPWPVYDVEVVGTHRYVFASGCKSMNCQDLDNDHLPIIKETMSASIHFGFTMNTGTPKTFILQL